MIVELKRDNIKVGVVTIHWRQNILLLETFHLLISCDDALTLTNGAGGWCSVLASSLPLSLSLSRVQSICFPCIRCLRYTFSLLPDAISMSMKGQIVIRCILWCCSTLMALEVLMSYVSHSPTHTCWQKLRRKVHSEPANTLMFCWLPARFEFTVISRSLYNVTKSISI